jgi:glycosyltransferase involved in cell wall biosynthesis
MFNCPQFVSITRRANPHARIILHMECDWLVQLDRKVLDSHLRSADVIAGCSDAVTDAIRERFPQYSERCTTIYNGVDTQVFYPRVRNEEEPDGERVIFVSRISPEKGLHVLLEAFEKVSKHRPDAVLEIAGSDIVMPMDVTISLSDNPTIRELERFYPGNYPENLRQRARAVFNGRVSFLGGLLHRQLAERIQQANVLVQPSVFDEPFGMAVAEAMASGVPVVASAAGGIPELVVDGETGLLVERDNPAALADAIIRLLADKQLARSMGEAGRVRAEATFSWECIVDSLHACYFDRPHQSKSVAAS